MIRINYLFIAIIFILGPFFHGVAQQQGQVDKWEQEFRLDREPSTYSENWKVERWGGAASAIVKGWLKTVSYSTVHGESAGVIWRYENAKEHGGWDGEKVSTIEFRVEIAARNRVAYGSSFVVTDNEKIYQFLLRPAAMATYRIELAHGKAKLFKEDSLVAIEESAGVVLENNEKKRNFLYFGDSGKGVDGTATWEFVRWTNSGIMPNKLHEKKQSFGYERSLDFSLFPDDARQWDNYNKSILLTDLSKVLPAKALTNGRREKGKWKVLFFKTDNLEGNLLSIYSRTTAQPVKLPLKNINGKYAVYIGMSSAPAFHSAARSGIRVKLGKEADFRNLFNETDWLDHKRDLITEVFYTVADLKANEVLEFNQIPNVPAAIAYVRLVPLKKNEFIAYNNDLNNQSYKSSVGAIDGHGMLLYNKASTASDVRGHFRMFENSDYKKWWFQVMGADLVNYPSKVGTLAGVGNEDFPRWYDEDFVASLESLIANKVNVLTVSRQMAKEQKKEFHVMIRPQGWAATMPFEETFNSKFYIENPQWRCVDEYGVPTTYMSYAVPEVRKQILAVIRETVELCDPDGVGLLFNRGMPLMLWEQAFKNIFEQKYKTKLDGVAFDDKRIEETRAEVMGGLLRDLRSMLNQIGQERGGKRYKISLAVLSQQQNKRHGIAIEEWIKAGLVDEVAVPPAEVKKYNDFQKQYQLKVYPLIEPWDSYPKAGDFSKRIHDLYENQVDGIAVWDADVEFYKKTTEPYLNQALRFMGHKELINFWKENRMPRPNTFRITQMGDNEYSGWTPGSGF